MEKNTPPRSWMPKMSIQCYWCESTEDLEVWDWERFSGGLPIQAPIGSEGVPPPACCAKCKKEKVGDYPEFHFEGDMRWATMLQWNMLPADFKTITQAMDYAPKEFLKRLEEENKKLPIWTGDFGDSLYLVAESDYGLFEGLVIASNAHDAADRWLTHIVPDDTDIFYESYQEIVEEFEEEWVETVTSADGKRWMPFSKVSIAKF